MRYFRIAFILGLALLIFSGCSKEDIQPDSLNATEDVSFKKANTPKKDIEQKKYVPFKGKFNVSVDLSSVDFRPMKYQFAYANGNATHLGKTKVRLEQWWWPKPGTDQNVYPWFGNGKGHIVFTAANGDILEASYIGAVATHNASPPVLVSLTATITGGDGRFEHATGSFDWDVEFYPSENTGTVVLNGIIKY